MDHMDAHAGRAPRESDAVMLDARIAAHTGRYVHFTPVSAACAGRMTASRRLSLRYAVPSFFATETFGYSRFLGGLRAHALMALPHGKHDQRAFHLRG